MRWSSAAGRCLSTLKDCDSADADRYDEEHRGADHQRPQHAVARSIMRGTLLQFTQLRVGTRHRSVEEADFDVGEVAIRCFSPGHHARQARSSQEVLVVAAPGVPFRRCSLDDAQHARAFCIFVEPTVEAWPRARYRLVRDHHDSAVHGEKSNVDQPLQHVSSGGVRQDPLEWHAAAGCKPSGPRSMSRRMSEQRAELPADQKSRIGTPIRPIERFLRRSPSSFVTRDRRRRHPLGDAMSPVEHGRDVEGSRHGRRSRGARARPVPARGEVRRAARVPR